MQLWPLLPSSSSVSWICVQYAYPISGTKPPGPPYADMFRVLQPGLRFFCLLFVAMRRRSVSIVSSHILARPYYFRWSRCPVLICLFCDQVLLLLIPVFRVANSGEGQKRNPWTCSETMLTGESRFHISPPRGFEPRSLVTGSKGLVHWTSETWREWSKIAGSPQGSPQQPTPSVVKPKGRPAVSMKPGQKSCVRSSGIITLSAQGPSDSSWRGPPQTTPQWWSTTSGSPMKRDNTNRRIPGDLNPGPLWREARG